MTVYSSKMQQVREVMTTPSNDWGGQGLLGVSIRFCSFEGANENVWHILEIYPHSPAEIAGLRAYSDYVIGADVVRHENDDLFTMIQTHEQQPLRIYVYNIDDDACREVVIKPNSNWGGEGALGCGIGYGYLHRIPIQAGNMINTIDSVLPNSFATSMNSSILLTTSSAVISGLPTVNISTATVAITSAVSIAPSLPYVPPLSNTFATNTMVNNTHIASSITEQSQHEKQFTSQGNDEIANSTQNVFKTYFNPDNFTQNAHENKQNDRSLIKTSVNESVKSNAMTTSSINPNSEIHIHGLFDTPITVMKSAASNIPSLITTSSVTLPITSALISNNSNSNITIGCTGGAVEVDNTNMAYSSVVTNNITNVGTSEGPAPVPMFATGGTLQYISSPIISFTHPTTLTTTSTSIPLISVTKEQNQPFSVAVNPTVKSSVANDLGQPLQVSQPPLQVITTYPGVQLNNETSIITSTFPIRNTTISSNGE